MFIKYTRDRRYASIVASYREGNKVKHRVLLNLGPVETEADRKRFEQILRDMRSGDEFVKVGELSAQNAREFGVAYTASKLLEKYGLDAILQKHLSMNKAQFKVYDIIKALIVNRLVAPSSDLAAFDWIKKHYDIRLQEQHTYRSLDYLIERKEAIEEEAFTALKRKLKLDAGTVHYDLTSSYVEGNSCSLAMFGYSRDHRPDRKQIVLGLMMCDGIPLAHEVYEGNTVDKTTLKDMRENLRGIGISSTIVADAGLLTEKNLEMLEDEKFQYILSQHRRNNNLSRRLLVRDIFGERQCAKEVHIGKIRRGDKDFRRRYVLCLNKETRGERLRTLKRIRNLVEGKLREAQEQYRQTKGKRMTRDDCMYKARKILGRNKRLFNLEFKDGLVYSINRENWEYEKKIAGKFLLVTNTDKKADDVMKAYKELQIVEDAFDEIKNFLNIRPIHHYNEERVRAHVFVCVLAFLIECLVERQSSQTARKVINELETIKSVEIVCGKFSRKLVTKPSPESMRIFDELKIAKPFVV